jgi:Flp pilus assembly pilin Flp
VQQTKAQVQAAPLAPRSPGGEVKRFVNQTYAEMRHIPGDLTLKQRVTHMAMQSAGTIRDPKRGSTRRMSMARDRRAVTATEYAVIAGVMVFAVLAATGPFAVGLGNLLSHLTDAL